MCIRDRIYADPVLKDEAGNTASSLAVNRSDNLVVITASTPGSVSYTHLLEKQLA